MTYIIFGVLSCVFGTIGIIAFAIDKEFNHLIFPSVFLIIGFALIIIGIFKQIKERHVIERALKMYFQNQKVIDKLIICNEENCNIIKVTKILSKAIANNSLPNNSIII